MGHIVIVSGFNVYSFRQGVMVSDGAGLVDLKFASPHWRFTFEQYLKDFLHYEPWEYEHLDWLYAEYLDILQS